MPPGIPKVFLGRRDRNIHKRGKSTEPKHRPLSAEAFFAIFKPTKQDDGGESEQEKKEREAAMIEEVNRKLAELDITPVNEDSVVYALNSKLSSGDVAKAVELIILQTRSYAGEILRYNPGADMLGAENRGNVTCYLDALLFAMFAKLEAFECMLTNELQDDGQRRLAALLRLWVNMLRSGKLIPVEMTEHIQDALAACGWPDAQLLEQQDTSEAFAFITETLQLPLLPLQVDLFHQGKNDEADHKVVYERLLNLAVPPDSEGKGIKLEDCLEEYFNSQVDVHRDSLDEKRRITLTPTPRSPNGGDTPSTPKSTIRIVTGDGEASVSSPMAESSEPAAELSEPVPESSEAMAESSEAMAESSEPVAESSAPTAESSEVTAESSGATAESSGAAAESSGATAKSSEAAAKSSEAAVPLERPCTENNGPCAPPEEPLPARPGRSRTESIIQRVVLDDQGRPSDPHNSSLFQKAKHSVVKAVTIPAWQFFRLIPWHSHDRHQEPQSDLEVARHFSQRPVVGICLKRYTMTAKGVPTRQNTFIDIPDSLRLPHFIVDERHIQESGLSTDYKLVLQSVVCHRGDSLHSGHYISFCRVAPKLLTDNRRHDSDPPPDYEEAQWVKFDDLSLEGRVTPIDDIRQSLKEEMPYLLFYQIVPIVEVPPSSTDGTDAEPPSYHDTNVNVNLAGSCTSAQDIPVISRQASSYFDNVSTLPSTSPSVRFSTDLERPRRSFADEEGFLSVSRRGSVVYDLSAGQSPGATPFEGHSPAVSPGEETTAQRLSRAAAKFRTNSKSRSESTAGEGRISLTMSRLSGLVKGGSREPLRDTTFLDPEDEHHLDMAAATTEPNGKEKSKEKQKEKSKDKDKDKDKDASHKRSRSKMRVDKGKAKEGKKTTGEVPDRECVIQ